MHEYVDKAQKPNIVPVLNQNPNRNLIKVPDNFPYQQFHLRAPHWGHLIDLDKVSSRSSSFSYPRPTDVGLLSIKVGFIQNEFIIKPPHSYFAPHGSNQCSVTLMLSEAEETENWTKIKEFIISPAPSPLSLLDNSLSLTNGGGDSNST